MLEFWHGRRTLITGIGGFVGANLARALQDHGAIVGGIDRAPSSPSMRALGVDAKAIVADVTDLAAMVNAMADVRPDVIYHLAGYSHIADCAAAPHQSFAINAMGTVAVLEAVRRATPEAAVVVASSNEVYPSGGPWREDRPEQRPEPRTLYGWTKRAQDDAARAYGQLLGLKTATLRHANAIGGANPHSTHLVQSVILALLGGQPVRLRSDGSPRKAYLAVQDVCAAYLLLGEALLTGRIRSGQAWNAGSDETPSARDVAERLAALAGRPGVVEVGPPQATGPDAGGYWQGLDSRRLAALGWTPRYLNVALAETWDWYVKHGATAWQDA